MHSPCQAQAQAHAWYTLEAPLYVAAFPSRSLEELNMPAAPSWSISRCDIISDGLLGLGRP